jgi:hypothetical protein
MNNFTRHPEKQFKCKDCNDLGITRVRGLYDATDTLMRCDCKEGAAHSRRELPQWIFQCGQLFYREPCPLEWFKPEKKDTLPEAQKEIWQKAEMWRGKLFVAENFWKQNTTNKEGE